IGQERAKGQGHPMITFTPRENALRPQSHTRFSADDVRRTAYEGLMLTTPAGVTYSGYGVANWDISVEPKTEDKLNAGLPFWHKALFMPGAKQMGEMANLMTSFAFWLLRPDPKVIVAASHDGSFHRRYSAACTSATNMAMVYM